LDTARPVQEATPYTSKFYEHQQGGARRSAEIIVPIVLRFVPAKSVIDVGCGVGAWLAVFQEQGVKDILGIDGDYVDARQLQIPRASFIARDLSRPLHLERTFDLAVSLEVAEHLPPESASSLVASLTALAPVVLFSAAIPWQGGTHHVNEQWPDYWANQFLRHGYVPVDVIRPSIWQNSGVDWWYAQNTLLFVESDFLRRHPALLRVYELTLHMQLNVVHPRCFENYMAHYVFGGSVKSLLVGLLVALRRGGRRRLEKLGVARLVPRRDYRRG
jgi:SAM-dependent methyltransferase